MKQQGLFFFLCKTSSNLILNTHTHRVTVSNKTRKMILHDKVGSGSMNSM